MRATEKAAQKAAMPVRSKLATRALVIRQRYIVSRIARPVVDSSVKLGWYPWLIERTLAWMFRFRRLAVRYDRRADTHLTFNTLAAAIIYLNQISRLCWML